MPVVETGQDNTVDQGAIEEQAKTIRPELIYTTRLLAMSQASQKKA